MPIMYAQIQLVPLYPVPPGLSPDLQSITLLPHPWAFIPLFPGSHLLPPPLLLMPGTHTMDVPHIMVMDTASGAIMGVMLATMVAMQAMATVAITVLDTDTMVESDA